MKILLVGHGYVGSYLLQFLKQQGIDVTCCDEHQGAPAVAIRSKYQALTAEQLAPFDTILWFAGHSNVPMSIKDPEGALANNCLDLLEFAKRKRPDAKMIYASTGSIYSFDASQADSGPMMLKESETRLNPVNPYDCSKVAFDAIATCFTENLTGIRMGTVAGVSPRTNPVLIFNSMNLAAINDKCVRVANSHASRGILFLEDLAFYMSRLIRKDALPRILNAASTHLTVGALATQISDFYGVEVIKQPDSHTYSFQMDCSAIHELCGQPAVKTIAERCDDFRRAYQASV